MSRRYWACRRQRKRGVCLARSTPEANLQHHLIFFPDITTHSARDRGFLFGLVEPSSLQIHGVCHPCRGLGRRPYAMSLARRWCSGSCHSRGASLKTSGPARRISGRVACRAKCHRMSTRRAELRLLRLFFRKPIPFATGSQLGRRRLGKWPVEPR